MNDKTEKPRATVGFFEFLTKRDLHFQSELTKSVAQSVTRRAALQKFGLGLAGMALACFGLANMAQAQFTYETNNGTITITGYTGSGSNVTIPSSTNGYLVTTIGDYAFYLSSLTNAMIPNSVTKIGDFAFGDSGLRSVTIGNSVTTLGSHAFFSCISLTSVMIPASVTILGDNAFAFCYSLTNTVIPNSVIAIGNNAFDSCSGLTSLTIGNSVTTIGDWAFAACYGLTNIAIPNSVITIGDHAFDSCYGLTSLTIGNSVTTIGAGAFYLSGLTSLTIPNSVTTIGDSAFTSCYSLTSVAFGNSVATIGHDAFNSCSMLPNIVIPNSVTNLGNSAFASCSALTNAFFQGNAPGVDGVAGSVDRSVFAGAIGKVYYVPGTTGWGSTFGGWPAVPILPRVGGNIGIHSGNFGFTITGATNQTVVVEACADLAHPVWLPIATNTLANGSSVFSDAKWTNHPSRFYRLRSP